MSSEAKENKPLVWSTNPDNKPVKPKDEKETKKYKHLRNSGRRFNSYQSWYRSITAKLEREKTLLESQKQPK